MAACYRGNDGHRPPFGHRRIKAVEKPDVIVADEDIDKPVQLAGLVKDAIAETGV